jgi:hypothetical protein
VLAALDDTDAGSGLAVLASVSLSSAEKKRLLLFDALLSFLQSAGYSKDPSQMPCNWLHFRAAARPFRMREGDTWSTNDATITSEGDHNCCLAARH